MEPCEESLRRRHVSIGTDGKAQQDRHRRQVARRPEKVLRGPGRSRDRSARRGPDIFNIVADWDDNMRYRRLADGLSKAGWTTGQVEKALGVKSDAVYGASFG